MPHMFMEHDSDPKADIIEKIGDLGDFTIANNQVLVGIYIRPEKTKSGIILSDKYRDEDRYQSKAALVLKMGPIAFEEDEPKWFKDFDVKVGDWIIYRPSDGWSISYKGVDCRLLDDTSIRGKITSPDNIW